MADIQTLKKLLAEEYGITTARELDEAMKKIGRLNIGVFASPVRKDGTKHEKVRSIARAGRRRYAGRNQICGAGC